MKILNIFSTDPWIWFHYLPLTGVVFLAHYFSSSLEQAVMQGLPYAWVKLFLFYAVWLAIGDQVIHWGLSKLVGRPVD